MPHPIYKPVGKDEQKILSDSFVVSRRISKGNGISIHCVNIVATDAIISDFNQFSSKTVG